MTTRIADATHGMMFAARHLSEQDRWDEARRIVGEIQALERATHPDGGAETEEGKDVRAREALALAGQLVRAVAGWAIDHIAGVASDAASSAEPTPPDDHRHEARGWSVRIDDGNADTVGRAVLTQLIDCNPGAFPQDAKRAAIASLDALGYGEVMPLVQPTTIDRRRRLSELRGQAKALAHAEYRTHLPNARKGEARKEVAAAYGIASETLRATWALRVPRELTEGEAERMLAEARRYAGARIVPDPDALPGCATRIFGDGTMAHGLDPYSDEALRSDGDAYQRLLGFDRSPITR